MKKLIALAAIAALAACGDREAEAPAAEETTAAADTTTAAAEGTQPGTYTVKMADGSTGTTVINADGTYTDTDSAGKVMKGTFARKDGKDCFDPEGDEAEQCWTVGVAGADGSFTATAPDGKTTVTVTPQGVTATATPAPAAT